MRREAQVERTQRGMGRGEMIVTNKAAEAVNVIMAEIESGNLKADDFKYNSHTDDTGLHESYEIESPRNDSAILILRDPLFCSIQAFEVITPVQIHIDKNSEYVPALIDRIKQLKEAR